MNFIPKFSGGGVYNSSLFHVNEIFASSEAEQLHRRSLQFEGVVR